jgi:hypothetical protein
MVISAVNNLLQWVGIPILLAILWIGLGFYQPTICAITVLIPIVLEVEVSVPVVVELDAKAKKIEHCLTSEDSFVALARAWNTWHV